MFRLRSLLPLLVVTVTVGQVAPQAPKISNSQFHDAASVPLSQVPVSAKKFRGASQIEHRVRKLNLPPKAVAAQRDSAVQSNVDRPFGVPASQAGPSSPKSSASNAASSSTTTRRQASATTAASGTTCEPSQAIQDGFEGIGQGCNAFYSVSGAPSDTTGAAGKTQYVEWVNEAFAVFKKDGTLQYGPTEGRTLWRNFDRSPDGKLHPCEKLNDGDPIVLYDRLADRWLLSQFAVNDGPPYYECIAISTSSDALGTYYRYAYEFADFDDYPKLGVWPDGYYASFNMFHDDAFAGAKACAFDRNKMLQGQEAQMICFDLPSMSGLLPTDLDGTTQPPSGTPNFFANFGSNKLNLWKFHTDWAAPQNTTFNQAPSISVPPFTVSCGDAGSCIPQPNSTQGLESLADRLMYRLAYRKFSDHESLTVNHSVQVNGNPPRSGVRWYEIRNPNSASPSLSQASTYSPDDTSRWMGSLASDKNGNLVLGYSASSGSINPSVRFAGRFVADPPNTLSAESKVIDGSGPQSLDRWGDYTSMSVDPDDCTFWFTAQYLAQAGGFNWHTYVAHIKFPDCH
jgi:hypothetical protein